MVALTLPENCSRCKEKLEKDFTIVILSPVIRKIKNGVQFSYSDQYHFCKNCVGDFEEWIKDYMSGSL